MGIWILMMYRDTFSDGVLLPDGGSLPERPNGNGSKLEHPVELGGMNMREASMLDSLEPPMRSYYNYRRNSCGTV